MSGWISAGYHKTIHVHWNSFGVEFGEEVQPGKDFIIKDMISWVIELKISLVLTYEFLQGVSMKPNFVANSGFSQRQKKNIFWGLTFCYMSKK